MHSDRIFSSLLLDIFGSFQQDWNFFGYRYLESVSIRLSLYLWLSLLTFTTSPKTQQSSDHLTLEKIKSLCVCVVVCGCVFSEVALFCWLRRRKTWPCINLTSTFRSSLSAHRLKLKIAFFHIFCIYEVSEGWTRAKVKFKSQIGI